MCGHRRPAGHGDVAVVEPTPVPVPTDPTPHGPGSGDPARPGGATRIGDDDRRSVDSVLAQAMSLGYLTLDEWGARSARVVAATTADELAAVTVDLPVTELRRDDPARRAQRAATTRRDIRTRTAGWLGLAVLMVVVWLAVAIPTGAWYPWPIWPILGTGIGLVSHVMPARAAMRSA